MLRWTRITFARDPKQTPRGGLGKFRGLFVFPCLFVVEPRQFPLAACEPPRAEPSPRGSSGVVVRYFGEHTGTSCPSEALSPAPLTCSRLRRGTRTRSRSRRRRATLPSSSPPEPTQQHRRQSTAETSVVPTCFCRSSPESSI
ncbi:Hypothetical protein SMAX5B_004829 [Scophthalmus maximus]|uniref:Uncharacterized protein n=1 Tax=Scophthalmus maximus TaxID=52904 RepID=A0A2U9B9Q9_SCOMX|nr:Hypothetical protein SMAX5B_004829 [Scophthalmus maximus]KAF0038734.1 hypothetical protein F2P81_009218 [Scophthalmus maximus]